jgi:FkbH-like protein/FkbM family methyltransferase
MIEILSKPGFEAIDPDVKPNPDNVRDLTDQTGAERTAEVARGAAKDGTLPAELAARGLISYHADSSKVTRVLCRAGIRSFAYLIDHGFQDLIVLPGSFFVELALCIHIDALHESVGSIMRINFRELVLLSEEDVTLSVGVERLNSRTVQYIFREAGGPGAGPAGGLPCVILEIECDDRSPANASATVLSIEAFQQQAVYLGDRAGFYQRLRENGNQYGPHFQNLRQVWCSGGEALGRLRVSRNASGTKGNHLDPIMMDSVVQLLSAFSLDLGRTFILKGIETIQILNSAIPEEAWVHARLQSGDKAKAAEGAGDVEVFDESGVCYLRLQGVKFAYLDRAEARQDGATPKTKIVIASTFTAEPVEKPLQFWGDYFGRPVQVVFAPYNQVFQELLTPGSQMRRNEEGLNVILLNLGDWVADAGAVALKSNPEKIAACFGGLERHVLPNGVEVAHLNRYETDYVYKEIFVDRCYLRHGIHLAENAVVMDIGANIGLFSLFIRKECPQASIYAFEPSPVAYQALNANFEAYGPGLQAFNVGVSDRRGSAPLTFYEKSSVFSTFHSSLEEDRQAIQAVVENMVKGELGGDGEAVDGYVAEFMTDRLERKIFQCPLVSVSDIIRENGLQRVDLLKVDAEKCELEILRGIEDSHWRMIGQVVVEIHDRSRRTVEEIQALLTQRGFQCAVEEEKLLAGSGLFNLYAIRPERQLPDDGEGRLALPPEAELQGKIHQFIQSLESFAQSATAMTLICVCPTRWKNSQPGVSGHELMAAESCLLRRARELPRVEVIGSEAVLSLCQASEFHDPHSNELGHIPYTAEGFAAIGSRLFRTFLALRRAPCKVIALDCDNTLWQGVCGEEGPLGVAVTPSHRALQSFMLQQMDAGVLLCLCSKNNEADVWAVFAQNPGMALRREHLAAWRVNWSPKSENLRSLARELNVGLESVIFLDDNPVECAEARSNAPEALTLQLPAAPGTLPRFLDQVWAFDHFRATEEDRTRTRKVLENGQRESYRGQVSTLKDFVDGLKLRVEVFEPAQDQISRVSQLTLRTNQFNFTTLRRSEEDVTRFLEKGGGHCLAAKASDRFGDYGMVGLLFYTVHGESYKIDTFLLSCRALGRGVEHQILARFGRQALERRIQRIELRFQPTSKNLPAREFIMSVGGDLERKEGEASVFAFSAARLADVRYDPNLLMTGPPRMEEAGSRASGMRPGSVVGAAMSRMSDKFQRIADSLNEAKKICVAIGAHGLSAEGDASRLFGEELPATVAGRILGIWRTTLGNPRVGMNDKFAEAGGTSLNAVQIVAAIRRELNVEISIVPFLKNTDVIELAAWVDGKLSKPIAPAAVSEGPVPNGRGSAAGRRQSNDVITGEL